MRNVPKPVIDALARAWLAEAKRLRSKANCDCGCGAEVTSAVRFKPGHDAKLLSGYRKQIEAIVREHI